MRELFNSGPRQRVAPGALVFAATIFLAGCGGDESQQTADPTSGTATIEVPVTQLPVGTSVATSCGQPAAISIETSFLTDPSWGDDQFWPPVGGTPTDLCGRWSFVIASPDGTFSTMDAEFWDNGWFVTTTDGLGTPDAMIPVSYSRWRFDATSQQLEICVSPDIDCITMFTGTPTGSGFSGDAEFSVNNTLGRFELTRKP